MFSHAKRKVSEGKLVKVEIEHDAFIKNIKITGDFFLHPEDTIEKIEQSLLGLEKDAGIETITAMIQKFSGDAQMIGISAESLASVIKEALK